jgi:hypothetical protein
MDAKQNRDNAEELDPAAPGPTDEISNVEVEAANLGLDGRGDLPIGESVEAPPGLEGKEGTPPALEVDIAKAAAFLQACITSNPRVRYGLGAKIRAGQVPGRDFQAVDCSGFVREAIRRSTALGNSFPDGSVVQHDWIKARGFAKVERSSGSRKDGGVRIAFLAPQDAPSRIGHVVLLHDGQTLESHGGIGPDSRPWTGTGWQAKASVYLLAPPD